MDMEAFGFGQTLFSMAVAAYLLIENTRRLREVTLILERISEQIGRCDRRD